MNIGTLIPRHARYRPDHPAVIFEDHRLDWAAFARRVNRLSNALLGLGLKKGDKVACILPNCLELLDVYWAAAQTGMVVVPLSPMLRGAGLTRLLNDSDSAAVITNAGFANILDGVRSEIRHIPDGHFILTDYSGQAGYQPYYRLVEDASQHFPSGIEIDRDDPYNIIYSSGTTGLPKGIVHTHYVRMMYCQGFASAYRITPESVVLHSGSLVFNGSFLTLMPAFYLGATYILHPRFDPEELIETVYREKVTHIMMVPSQIIAMMHAQNFDPDKLASLEMICTVGAPFHKEHKENFTRLLPGIFYELYGLTEGFVTILDRTDVPAKLDSVGSPPPLYEMRIMDSNGNDLPPGQVGEIVGRGPILMPGYYKRPDLTEKAIVDGWLHTGDLGYMDEDGYLFLVDRQKDLIISGGVNVYPRDIEELLVQHEAVREAAVFGVPDDKWGETPLAAVILVEPGAAQPDDIKEWLNERVEARYQQVREVVIKETFPRSVAGKTLKRVMRDEYWRDSGQKI